MNDAKPLIDLMTKQQREELNELISRNRDATWVVEGGFTPISEELDGNGGYLPCWGKVTYENERSIPGSGPSATEEASFVDVLQLRQKLHKKGANNSLQFLTLSDSQWYKQRRDDSEHHLPHERRHALSERISKNPQGYVPGTYKKHLKRHAPSVNQELDIVLQHTFSPTFQHCLTNSYANLRKKKNNPDFALRFHKRMFLKKRGWLYLEGDMDGGKMKLFSGPSIRASVFEEDSPLERSVKEEGAIGVTYSYTEDEQGASKLVNTHMCGSVSAGRMMWLTRAARERRNLRAEDRVVTVHIHDTADDVNIGRKLFRGMLASSNAGPENNLTVLLIKNGDQVDFLYEYGNTGGSMSEGAPLHRLLGFKKPDTLDRKIDQIADSAEFSELFEREIQNAQDRASQSLGLENISLLNTGKAYSSAANIVDLGAERHCEVMCST